MRLSVDSYLGRRFNLARYNCWHLVRDGWLELTGLDLGDRTPERISTAALIGRFDNDVPEFEQLADPASPCIILMQQAGAVPHVGLFYRGKVLQMTAGGASYLPLDTATRGYGLISFYR